MGEAGVEVRCRGAPFGSGGSRVLPGAKGGAGGEGDRDLFADMLGFVLLCTRISHYKVPWPSG